MVERVYWWMVKHLYRAERVRQGDLELAFVDVRVRPTRNPGEIRAVLADALERISIAKGGFGELVTSHLSLVAAMPVREERILSQARIYVCNFEGAERTNGHYLACLLIWAATSMRLARDAAARKVSFDDEVVAKASRDAQLRFVKQFPDWEQWVETLSMDKR